MAKLTPSQLSKSLADFIHDANAKHNNKFEYDVATFLGRHTLMSIKCPFHGPFEQTPHNHLKYTGCNKCAREIQSDRRRSCTNDFIRDAVAVHGNVYDYSRVEYISTHEKVTIVCPVHGPFEQTPNKHLMGSTCLDCKFDGQKHTTQSFIEKVESIHGKLYDYSRVEYISAHEKVTIVCPVHGPFEQTPSSHGSGTRCPKCAGWGPSIQETEVYTYIKTLSQTAVQSDRTVLKPKELDIYDPDSKIAIEFDGLYWHSSGSKETDAESRKKHVHKTDECNKLGIQLFHVFENEWNEKPEIWKSVIRNAYGQSSKVYARQCEIGAVDSKTARAFCDANHLQGGSNSSIAYGLYHNTVLVSLMTFGPARYSDAKYELLRFCNKLGLTVVGGASKIIKHFRKNHPGSIVSYANKRWSIGNLYDALGFEYLHDSDPCYWYFKTDDATMFHRSSFMKHKLKDKLETFDPDMSEVDNMYANGYRRIWDSGNKVYILR